MPKCIVRLELFFRVVNPVIIPPFSAKVSRLILNRISKRYSEMSGEERVFKPVSVSPVFLGDRPLLKLKGSSGMLYLGSDRLYRFNCGMIVDGGSGFDDVVSFENDTVEGVFGTKAVLEKISIAVKDLRSLGFRKPKGLRISFLSPLLLQLPSFGRVRRDRDRYILFPIPSLIIGSLAEHWNANCDPELVIKRPAYLSYYSNYLLMEADYSLKPVTVVYDEKRSVRGLQGWVFYDLKKVRNTPSVKRIMTLLEYAQYVGVGKSRAAGFGQVDVKRVD